MYDGINGMIQRTTRGVVSVRPDVENHVFNGHQLGREDIAKIYGTLTEAINSYTAMLCVLNPDDSGRTIVLNNRGFTRYMAGLIRMRHNHPETRQLLEAAEQDLTEASKSSLGAAAINLQRVKKALSGELSK